MRSPARQRPARAAHGVGEAPREPRCIGPDGDAAKRRRAGACRPAWSRIALSGQASTLPLRLSPCPGCCVACGNRWRGARDVQDAAYSRVAWWCNAIASVSATCLARREARCHVTCAGRSRHYHCRSAVQMSLSRTGSACAEGVPGPARRAAHAAARAAAPNAARRLSRCRMAEAARRPGATPVVRQSQHQRDRRGLDTRRCSSCAVRALTRSMHRWPLPTRFLARGPSKALAVLATVRHQVCMRAPERRAPPHIGLMGARQPDARRDGPRLPRRTCTTAQPAAGQSVLRTSRRGVNAALDEARHPQLRRARSRLAYTEQVRHGNCGPVDSVRSRALLERRLGPARAAHAGPWTTSARQVPAPC